MKNIIIFILGLFTYSFSFSQAQIPNSSFENWSEVNGCYELDNWYSLNIVSAQYPQMGTLRSNDAYDGNYSLRLVSSPVNMPDYNLYDTLANAVLGSLSLVDGPHDGDSYTDRPNYCSFYFKYYPSTLMPDIIDTAYFFIKFVNQDTNVGYAHWFYAGAEVDSWTKVTLSIHYFNNLTPDSVYANFTSSLNGFVKSDSIMTVHFLNAIGNELRVDKLELFNQVALPEEAEDINEISIYPNPCKDDLNLIFNNNKPENLNYSIYDITGKRIKSDFIKDTKISTRELSSGFYILELSKNGYSVREKFIVK
ncbi:MAG: T9SS type A sorting domain-containing protein [Bacteroidales bacterium]